MLIYNPHAGKGKVKNALHTIIEGFFQEGDLVTCFPTAHKDHATELIQTYGKDFELLICCGGDGTLNEVINGLLSLKQPLPLAYIPSGTVNDFANTLKLSANAQKAVAAFKEGNTFACDICSFNDRFFTYVAAFGAFTEVSYRTPQATKNLLGRAAYFLEGLKQFPNITTYHMRITASDRIIDDDFVFGAVTNARSIAGFHSINTK